jgi:hypothetical protein
LNPRPHEAQLEDPKNQKKKAQECHLVEAKAAIPTKGTKNGKPSQNDKEEPRKAQKHKKLIKLLLNQLPLTLSMQALPLR